MQKEMQEAGDAGFGVVGQTVFESTFGGKETAAILEKGTAGGERFEYKLLATSKTSTMEKELRELVEGGYQAIGLTRRQDRAGRQRAGGDQPPQGQVRLG